MKEMSTRKKILEWKIFSIFWKKNQDKYIFFENDTFEIETAMYFIFFSGLESLSFWGVKFI